MMPFQSAVSKNIPAISQQEQKTLSSFKVAVVGCGGLGQYILEYLIRLGFTQLTIIDEDCFHTTNLNRQLLATPDTLNQSKVRITKDHLLTLNPKASITIYNKMLKDDNAQNLLAHHHIIFDALDTISSRFTLATTCDTLKIPLIHGAINGWQGQVATILPGDNLYTKIYASGDSEWANHLLHPTSSLAFTPPLVASFQVAEALKLLLGRNSHLRHQLLHINLLTNQFVTVEL